MNGYIYISDTFYEKNTQVLEKHWDEDDDQDEEKIEG